MGEYKIYNQSVMRDTLFSANYNSSSDNCIIEYCSFIDYGVIGNNNSENVMLYSGLRSITDNGTLLTTDNDNRWDIRPKNFGLFSTPFTLIFNIVETSNKFAFYGYNSSTSLILQMDTGAILKNGDTVKIVVNNTNATLSVNNVQKKQLTYNSTSSFKLRIFWNTAGNYLKYRDLHIKQL